jgi:hypothetical protein
VTVCHRTGNKKKPYVKIRISKSALPAHLKHGDIYPAPRSCPTKVVKTNGKGKVLGAGHFTGYKPLHRLRDP